MKPLTVLATATSGWGHINACSGTVSKLLTRGHRVIFVLEEAFRGKLVEALKKDFLKAQSEALDFEEFIYSPTKKEKSSHSNAGDKFAADLLVSKMFGPEPPLEKLVTMVAYLDGPLRIGDVAELDGGMRQAIDKFKPDLIVYDGNACLPAIHYSQIPWVRCISNSPQTYIMDDSIPPGASGLPTDSNRSEWAAFNEIRKGMFYGKPLNDKFEELGYQRFPDDLRSPGSEILTVYAYPEEINYEAIRKAGWFNLEVFNKNETKKVVELDKLVPQGFLDDTLNGKWSGKFIYVSQGSLASYDLDLMKRLVEVLGKTNHKYIVAKGARHAEYELADNMWGERFLPQTEIVPLVDLVITHGGNNTVTETFAQGKPMIVMPNFADQFDNAQRLDETGFGVRLDPYRFTDKELTNAVDKLLYNEKLKCDLQAASARIQATDRHSELAIKIEQFFTDKK